MTWVKVCGLRRPDDVEAAAAAGADAVGLVLIHSSPRVVSRETAADLAGRSRVPAFILTLDLDPESAADLVHDLGVAGIQPYGEGAGAVASAVLEAGGEVLFPLRVRGPVDLSAVTPGATPFLDAYSEHALGGTGRTIDPTYLPPTGERYVLAGGLRPENVADVVATHRPWGVDASSGLESAPGVKDPARIASFVKRAKDA